MTLQKHQGLDFSIRLYGCVPLFFAVFSHTDTYMIEQEYEASGQEQKRDIEKQKFTHSLTCPFSKFIQILYITFLSKF